MNTILNEMTTELNNLKWSKSSNKKYGRQSLNVAETPDEEPHRFYFISGLIRDWSARYHNNFTPSLRISKANKLPKHQRIIELATKYIELLDPNFTYLWNFGDGTSNSKDRVVTHRYSDAGTYTVSLTVTTDKGCTTTLTKNNYII
mgnify:CR=1 FL=1